MGKVLGSAQIRNKGEITLPKEVRKLLNIKPGDKISIIQDGKKILIKRQKTIYEDFDLTDEPIE